MPENPDKDDSLSSLENSDNENRDSEKENVMLNLSLGLPVHYSSSSNESSSSSNESSSRPMSEEDEVNEVEENHFKTEDALGNCVTECQVLNDPELTVSKTASALSMQNQPKVTRDVTRPALMGDKPLTLQNKSKLTLNSATDDLLKTNTKSEPAKKAQKKITLGGKNGLKGDVRNPPKIPPGSRVPTLSQSANTFRSVNRSNSPLVLSVKRTDPVNSPKVAPCSANYRPNLDSRGAGGSENPALCAFRGASGRMGPKPANRKLPDKKSADILTSASSEQLKTPIGLRPRVPCDKTLVRKASSRSTKDSSVSADAPGKDFNDTAEQQQPTSCMHLLDVGGTDDAMTSKITESLTQLLSGKLAQCAKLLSRIIEISFLFT